MGVGQKTLAKIKKITFNPFFNAILSLFPFPFFISPLNHHYNFFPQRPRWKIDFLGIRYQRKSAKNKVHLMLCQEVL